MTGAEAAGVFYDPARFKRAGAAPSPLQKTLFGQGGVQGMDGENHRQRKAMFLQIVQRDRVEALAEAVTREWQRAQDDWIAEGDIQLYPDMQKLLTSEDCGWAGVHMPGTERVARPPASRALFDPPGHTR